MDQATALVAGACFGLLGCIAPALLFEQALKKGTRVSVGAGMASILVSFLALSGALLVAYLVASERLLEFGCSMVASFLLFWGVEARRAWRAANGRG